MKDIVNKFKIEGEVLDVNPFANGLVNKTYLVITTKNKYLLQKINDFVFKSPDKLMKNIENVTNHLKKKNCLTLTIVKTKNEQSYYVKKNQGYYRIYEFLDDLYTINEEEYRKLPMEIGIAIGNFQVNFCDFNLKTLNETIPNFHNTPKRIEKLIEAFNYSTDLSRKEKALKIYNYILLEKNNVSVIQEKFNKGLIPLRITHNDTKLNNILFDKATNKAACLIDLDTVMPGIALFDFGDAVRASCTTCTEDSCNYPLVDLDMKKVVYLIAGYLSKMYQTLNKEEIKLLITSIGTIIIECSTRFLTDYLENDVYFKISYKEHNLVRATNQMYLYKSYKAKKAELEKISNIIIERMTRYNELSL